MPDAQTLSTTNERPLLFTPGPAGTEDSVKQAQVFPDISPRTEPFKSLLADILVGLTRIAGQPGVQDTVLVGGSGTAAVEAMLVTAGANDQHLLIIDNGAYGRRMADIAASNGLRHTVFRDDPCKPLDRDRLEQTLKDSPRSVDYIAVVHHETTTGLLNQLEPLHALAQRHGARLLVDAMSSFAALPIDMCALDIAYLAASANKNLGGMAGASFVIARRDELLAARQHPPRSFYLNLAAEHEYFEKHGQTRFTAPVQTLAALNQALRNYQREGRENRLRRYRNNWRLLLEETAKLGFRPLVEPEHQAGLMLSLEPPAGEAFRFEPLSAWFEQHGITIYPGKLPGINSLRLATIGTLGQDDIAIFLELLNQYCAATQENNRES